MSASLKKPSKNADLLLGVSRKPRVSIHTKVRVGFACALVLLIMIGFICQSLLRQSIKETAAVTHTEDVLGELIDVAGALGSAGSNERGFLLTGDPKLRKEFEDARQQLAVHFARLRSLTADNPRRQKQLNTLEPLLRQALSAEGSILARQGAHSHPLFTPESLDSRKTMIPIRALFEQIGVEEAQLLHKRSSSSRHSSVVARVVVATGSILGGILVILCFLSLTRHLRRREQAEADFLNLKEDLEERVRERTSELNGLTASLRAEIAERRKAEQQLRESEQRHRLVAMAAKGAIWNWDLVSNQVQWSDGDEIPFGYTTEQIGETSWQERLHPDDRERIVASIQAVIDSTEDHWSNEYRYRRAEGSYADVLDRGYVVRDSDGKALHMIGSMLDLTEHRQAERALQESEKRYRMLFEDSPLPMCVYDAETLLFLVANRAIEGMYGYSREEFLSMTLRDIQSPEEIPATLDSLKAAADTDCYSGAFVTRHKSGTLITIAVNARGIVFGSRNARLALVTDITEQKRLESQLRQSQKMEAVGRLAGGIAHDFNNLLTVILGYSDGILRTLAANDPLYNKVSEIQAAGQRAASLTRQLLAFSRKQILQVQALDLNAVVSDINQMVHRLLGEDIRITLHLESALGQIQADRTQLEQALLNLAVNARDAMPRGGELIIETHNVEVGQESASLQGIPAGHYVVLSVSDTGCGMDEETRGKIFEPFFTTKGVGKGTGLGLSMVLGLVQQSGGTVTVYSEPNVGTTFRIYLPSLDSPVTQSHEADKSKAIASSGKGASILLVEDEARVRTLARDVLREAGYIVTEASNGREALEIAESWPRPPAMLLTDVVMPEMSGPDLAEHLRKKWPGLRVVFTSGYTDHALLARSTFQQDTIFLQKPYTPGSLLEQVAKTLERTNPTVLIIDDDEQVLRLLRTVFEEAGYVVLEASNGREALARMTGHPVNLVVTDLVMPEKEGLETIQELRRKYPEVKILAISGTFGGSYLKMASRLGADGILAKPFQREQFLEAVENSLS